MPLYLRVLIGVALGALLGVAFDNEAYLLGLKNEHLGQMGMLVIRLIKALAVPLILFAILDAFVHTAITARSGLRLVLICLVNVSVAFTIGLTLMNTLKPGLAWSGHLEEMVSQQAGEASSLAPKSAVEPSLDPLKNLSGYIPQSLLEPFVSNNLISVVLIALIFGAALRWFKERQGDDEIPDTRPLEGVITAIYQILVKVLMWVVEAVPFAVFGLVAQVVGKSGLEVFTLLGSYLGVISLGLLIHSLLYYPLMAWLVGKKSPREYLGKGADAIITGMSINSSLATMPVTLRCLERMGVSAASARLSACIGTNLNNDGVTLYEAMAALFLAQAMGFATDFGQQATIVLSALMAGVGIAGIPEAGLIVLPLVLSAAGLPETIVAAAIPLVLPVDWIIARIRSMVNVMSDMLVAILLDAGGK
jgi:DAACS family dicarboxylate/amino acid:cation (Na+ or H+) symporter